MLVVNTVQPNVSSGKSSVACGNFEEVTREFAGTKLTKTTSKEKRRKKEGRTTAARLEKSGGKFASWKSQKRPTATSESGSTPTDPINLSSTFGGKFGKQKV